MEKYTVKQLQTILRKKGLPVSGKKSLLIARLSQKMEKVEKPLVEKPNVEKKVLKPLSDKKEKDKKNLVKKYFDTFPQIKYNPLTNQELKEKLRERSQIDSGRSKNVLIKRLVEKDKSDFLKKMVLTTSFLEACLLRKKVQQNFEFIVNIDSKFEDAQKKILKKWIQHRNKTLDIISVIKEKQEILQKFHFCIQKILIENPPAKNENKFIYGKLVEYAVFNMIEKIGLQCIDLDQKQKVGSEFKNDCVIQNQKFSVKTLKNYSDIILINKNSNDRKYSTKTNYLLCVIEQAKLYLFPSYLYSEKDFIVDNEANISMKKSIFNYLEDKYPQYVINLPKMSKEQIEVLEKCKEKNRIKEIFESEYAF